MALLDWPAMDDDTGAGTDGTGLDEAFFTALREAVEDETYDPANPTIKLRTLIQEIINARGNLGSIDERLEHVVDDDGNPVFGAGVVSTTILQSVIGILNLLANETFLLWSAGDAAAPDHFTLSGTGAVVARAGSGLGDATRKVGKFCAALTYGSTAARLTQAILDAAVFGDADILRGYTVGFGGWAFADEANSVCFFFDDGVDLTRTAYHPGDSTWRFLSATHEINVAASKLENGGEVGAAGTGYFSGLYCGLGDVAPSMWIPTPKLYGARSFPLGSGDAAAGNEKGWWLPGRPALVKYIQLGVRTAPTGQALIVDGNSWDGAAFTSMFATKPQIADGAFYGGAAPDGTYARRCLAGHNGSGALVGSGAFSLDVDQVGSGVSGAKLIAEVRCLQYMRVLEDLLAFNDY